MAVYLIRWFSGVVAFRQAATREQASKRAEREAGRPVEVRLLDPASIAELTREGHPLPVAARRLLEDHRARKRGKRKKRPAMAPAGP